jgi:hypothetical protein
MNIKKVIISQSTIALYFSNNTLKEFVVNIPGEFGDGYDFDVPMEDFKYCSYLMSHGETIVKEVNRLRETGESMKDITRLINKNGTKDKQQFRRDLNKNGVTMIVKK